MTTSSLRLGFANPLLLGAVLGLGLSGSVGVGAVWLRHQISVTANENKVLEAHIADLERQSEQLDTEIAEQEDAQVLLARQEQWKLGMVAPSAERVHHFTQDPLRHLSEKHGESIGVPPPSLAPGLGLALEH